MTHNEAIRARGSSSTPRYESLARSDAGHQRKGSGLGSSRSAPTGGYKEQSNGQLQTSPGSTPEIEDHQTPLYQLIQTPNTPNSIYAQDSRSHTPSTQGQCRASRNFGNSPSPPKRSCNSMSDLSTETVSSSPLALGVGGIPAIGDEMLSKRLKQESVR